MNFKQLEAFVWVTELQSFTRAAKQLYMSQPAISFQIKALEEDLKVILFQRNEKKVILTEAGRLLYPEAKKMLGQYNKIKVGLDALRGLKTGHLVIGASTIPGEYLLPFIIGEYKKKYPGIMVTLRVAGSGGVINWVSEREIDLGVVGKTQKISNLKFSEWVQDDLVLIVPSNHHWSGKNIDITEITKEKLILREDGSGTRNSMFRIFNKHNINSNELNIEMELGSTRAVFSAVQAGIGVGFVSRWSVVDALNEGKIGEVKLNNVNTSRSLYIVRYFPEIINYAADAFAELLYAVKNDNKILKQEK